MREWLIGGGLACMLLVLGDAYPDEHRRGHETAARPFLVGALGGLETMDA